MKTTLRLIEKFVPENYNLSLNINQNDHTFSGIVTINGQTTTSEKQVVFHAKEINISSVIVDGQNAEFSQTDSEIVVALPKPKAAKHVIVASFSGQINDSLHGMYLCRYKQKGYTKELVVTQFESHHAREVFPCIDEPEAKATFDVTLTTKTGMTTLSNMPIKHQRQEDGQLVTTFEQTPRMSTYLLAWVVGKLHSKTAKTNDGVEVSVWATPVQPTESLDFALDIAKRSIEFYNDYFGVPYPLPKSDQVALPDFSSGAMENWGLVTYREVALLADPETASLSTKRYIATVIAHELSHQWFGNLVTMKWWNNLWLNESFATLMEYIAVDHLQPDWNIWLDFASFETTSALQRDSIDGVQAVQTDVSHPDEISTLFDGSIVYAKGARLMRMLQNYIGDEAFQTGLKSYFKKYAYKNTEGDDLWKELSAASGKDIASFMNAWILQSGFPVVEVDLKDNRLKLSQKRFFVGPHESSSQTWPIPLNASTNVVPNILTDKSQTIKITDTPKKPLRLNVGNTAHFITKYSPELLDDLISSLKNGGLQPLDRLQLLGEQILLARSGATRSFELILLLSAYKDESNDAVWDNIAIAINELKKFIDPKTPADQALRNFAGKLAERQYERLAWKPTQGESDADRKLRSTIIDLMLYARNPDALAESSRLYESREMSKLDPELRASIIGSVAYDSTNPDIIEGMLKVYKTTSSAELKQDITAGVTSTQKPEFINKLLETIKDPSIVRSQDVIFWYIRLLRNRSGRTLAWQWLRDNWSWIEQMYSGDKSYDSFPRYTGSILSTRQELAEYISFFEPMKSNLALTRNISVGISEIEGRVELIERDKADVEKTLLQIQK